MDNAAAMDRDNNSLGQDRSTDKLLGQAPVESSAGSMVEMEPSSGRQSASEGESPSVVMIPPKIAALMERFRRDLPGLLASHYGEWIAYYGDDEVQFGQSKRELFNAGIARGLTADEFMVRCVVPAMPDVIDADEWRNR